MKNDDTEKIVLNSINDGITAGVQGTPSTFVLLKTRKGYETVSMVDGARPYEFFKAVVEEALSR
jgi:predicted DsbA family dithiol-disulfide isomerase